MSENSNFGLYNLILSSPTYRWHNKRLKIWKFRATIYICMYSFVSTSKYILFLFLWLVSTCYTKILSLIYIRNRQIVRKQKDLQSLLNTNFCATIVLTLINVPHFQNSFVKLTSAHSVILVIRNAAQWAVASQAFIRLASRTEALTPFATKVINSVPMSNAIQTLFSRSSQCDFRERPCW